jgi:hypothetical protein
MSRVFKVQPLNMVLDDSGRLKAVGLGTVTFGG